MATQINWPTALGPYTRTNGLGEQIGAQTLRTEMEQGPPKYRRISQRRPQEFEVEILCDGITNKNLINTFYNNTTFGGSQSFNFPDPYNPSGTIEVIFKEPPSIKPINDRSPTVFIASLVVETVF